MKAIRKEDGKEIEVRIYTEKQYVQTEAEEGEIGKRVYREDALIIKEAVDWKTFHREAAKDFMCTLILVDKGRGSFAQTSSELNARVAIAYADELIKQLKYGE